MDEELAARIARDDTSGLAEHHRLALSYADLQMTYPSRVGDDLRERLHQYFTQRQIVELTLDIVAWNRQKVRVALGIDRAVDDQALSPLTFDADGHSRIGAPGPAAPR